MKRRNLLLSAFTALIVISSALCIAMGCSSGGSSTDRSYWLNDGNTRQRAWQPNMRVDVATGTTDVGSPCIAVDLLENAYAIWMDLRNGNYDIYFSLYK